jgi:hypothetical protein
MVVLLIGLTYHPTIAPVLSPSITSNLTTESPVRKPLSKEEIWGETGATVLPLAANIMHLRNPQNQGLTPEQKKYLQPFFGDLVDRVKISYNAQLMDRWSTLDQEIHIGEIDSLAQTYGLDIYVRSPYELRNRKQLILLSHELVHVQQYLRFGNISKFGYEYFSAYYKAGKKYALNPLEIEAKSMEKKFAQTI